MPPIVLWAWERPEDLRFADPRKVGVAFLAQTIFVRGEESGEAGISVRPRLQPLRFSAGTKLMAVTRIEARGVSFADAKAGAEKAHSIASMIATTSEMTDVAAVQVDFDASESQREFYGEVLSDLRAQIPPETPISITALASWCMNDDWLERLPIDEAVPMLFRMGADGRSIRRRLAAGEDFRAAACRGSLGLSTDEGFATVRRGGSSRQRIYLFDPHPWNAAAFHEALRGESQ